MNDEYSRNLRWTAAGAVFVSLAFTIMLVAIAGSAQLARQDAKAYVDRERESRPMLPSR